MGIIMKILIACEESQVITKEFREQGHDAYSCDIKECTGDLPQYHIKSDVMELLEVLPDKFYDLIIAHPPCTCLSVCGNGTYAKGKGRYQERLDAVKWTEDLWELCKRKAKSVCFENPVGTLSTLSKMGKPTQYIQPYEFGHTETKKTGLWLYNLPKLKGTEDVKAEMDLLPAKEKHKIWYCSPSKERGAIRSKTYKGIANAIVNQWGVKSRNKKEN